MGGKGLATLSGCWLLAAIWSLADNHCHLSLSVSCFWVINGVSVNTLSLRSPNAQRMLMLLDLHYQCDWIKRHLGDALLGKSVGVFTVLLIRGDPPYMVGATLRCWVLK